MGKRIISQARGKGSHTYKVRRQAFNIRLFYPRHLIGEGKVIKLINSSGHFSPIAKIMYKLNKEDVVFFIPAHKNMSEGDIIHFGNDLKDIKPGNILELKNIPINTAIYNIESRPFDGGKFIKTGGTSGIVNKIVNEEVYVIMPSKKEKKFNKNCRAIVGVVAGDGRLDKPFVKAGNRFHAKKAKSKLYPRTSAIKMNAIDHPFGSGRGKNPKSKIAKRNAPPGPKIGLLRPRRTGRKKR